MNEKIVKKKVRVTFKKRTKKIDDFYGIWLWMMKRIYKNGKISSEPKTKMLENGWETIMEGTQKEINYFTKYTIFTRGQNYSLKVMGVNIEFI